MGRMKVLGWQALSVAAGLLVWEALVRWGVLDPLFVPAPSSVLSVFGATATDALPRLGDTLVKTLLGYALAVGVGVPAGLLLGSRPTAHAVAMPYVVALYAVPSVVWYPSLMLFFGLGPASKIAFGVLLGFFPVTLAVLAGIRQVPATLVTVAFSMGAGPWTMFRKVMLPAMASTMVGGLRTGLALSDRIAVMTARPGRIKDVLEVSLPYPRTLDAPEAVDLHARLWAQLREESLRAMDGQR